MHSELSEALDYFRNGRRITEIQYERPHPQTGWTNSSESETETGVHQHKPIGVAVELADCIIRIFDTCAHFGIPIEEALKIKMEYNKTRPYRHGGKKI